MKTIISTTILSLALASISLATPSNLKPSKTDLLQAQWTSALQIEAVKSNAASMKKVAVVFTIDQHNKVKILNTTGADKETYIYVKQRLDGLDNITELQPNEVYRIDISFQVV